MLKRLSIFVVGVLITSAYSLMACPACKNTQITSDEGQNWAGGLTSGVSFMIFLPLLALGIISFMIFRAYRSGRLVA